MYLTPYLNGFFYLNDLVVFWRLTVLKCMKKSVMRELITACVGPADDQRSGNPAGDRKIANLFYSVSVSWCCRHRRCCNLINVYCTYTVERFSEYLNSEPTRLSGQCLFYRLLCQVCLFKGNVQRESRRVWSNISTRYLVWGCGEGRSFILWWGRHLV